MQGKAWLALIPVILLAGCATQGPVSDQVQTDTVTLHLTQDTADGSPVQDDADNCLVVIPAEDATPPDLSVTLEWVSSGDAPDRLRMRIFEVEGGQTLADATGGPGLEAGAGGLDAKVNVAVTLAEGSQASVERLPLELTYEANGPTPTVRTAACHP